MVKRGSKVELIQEDDTKKRRGKTFKRKLWSAEEDNAIRNLVKEIGECNWGTIADRMNTDYGIKGRTGKQCRERWHNHLAPDVKKEPLTAEEENQIFLLHITQGLKWAEIAKKLGKRTDNAIKNHFYATLRRYMRRANKIMKSEAFRNLTKYPLVKLTCDYIYRCLIDKRIKYKELATVDSDKWQWINKHYLKQLSLKKNEEEFKDLKKKLNSNVDRKIKRLVKKEEEGQNEDGSQSRRSSRLCTKKRNNYSEESENYNLFLLIDLINYESGAEKPANQHKTAFKRVKVGENDEEEKTILRQPSRMVSIQSIGGKSKRSLHRLQNKKLDEILGNEESDKESEAESLEMNIGKKIKMSTVKGNKPNKAFAAAEDRNFSSVSFLQNVRNISKTSSVRQQSKGLGMFKASSGFKNPIANPSIANIYDKNISIGFDKFGAGSFTRNKTKIFNLEGSNRYAREESDPAYRQSVFNEGNNFQTADHYFGFNDQAQQFENTRLSNPFNIVKEISAPKPKNPTPSQMPRLKSENFQNNGMMGKEMSHPYLNRSNNTASFGQISLRSGRRVSQPINVRSKSSATKILKRERDVSLPSMGQVRTRSSALKMKK